MKMIRVLSIVGVIAVMILGSVMAQADKPTDSATAEKTNSVSDVETATQETQIVAYYFHGTQRCPTCMKLEAYSYEALEGGFDQQLQDSTIVWKVVNYDEEEFKHYIDDYKLYTKAVVLSRVVDGEETEWKNLDKIWQLVGDKDEFVAYVKTETKAFVEGPTE
jgi:hypothetical protein